MKKLFVGLALLLWGTSKLKDKGSTPQGSDNRSNDTKIPRSIRNNNPGNLKSVKTATSPNWKGTVGLDDHRPSPHVIFENYTYGTRAMILDVRNKIRAGLNTPGKILAKYCPASDGCNNASYLTTIDKLADIAQNQQLQYTNKEQMYRLLKAMTHHETGFDNPNFTKSVFNDAWGMIS